MFFKRTRRRRLRFYYRRTLITSAVAIVAFIVASVLWVQFTKHARGKVVERIAQMEKRLGHTIEVDRIRFGIGEALLENVRVRGKVRIFAAKVSASLNLNPFSQYFTEIDDVEVVQYRVIVRQPTAKQGSSDASSAIPQLAKKNLRSLFERVPVTGRIEARHGKATLVSASNQRLIRVSGLRLRYEAEKTKLQVAARKVEDHQGRSDHYLIATLEERTNGSLQGSIKAQNPDSKETRYRIEGTWSPSQKRASMTGKLRYLPSMLQQSVFGHLTEDTPINAQFRATAKQHAQDIWDWQANWRSHGISVKAEILSEERVGPLPLQGKAQGRLNLRAPQLQVEHFELGIPNEKRAIKVIGRAFAQQVLEPAPRWQINVSAKLPRTSCQSVFDAVPENLIPALSGFTLSGHLAGQAEFAINSAEIADFQYRIADPVFSCRVTRSPYYFSKAHLQGPIALQREQAKGKKPIDLYLHPQAKTYVGFKDFGKDLKRTMIASEDAAFWKHKGVDLSAIEFAFRKNISEGRVVVGGSTITMQTVKNIFLNHKRTVSRKLQEVFLAWHLEKTLDKERILELYLNVAEFGPGVYGIKQASRTYFDKHPFDLNIKESAFLASLLPSPRKRFRHFCTGKPTEAFNGMMDGLLRRMLNLKRINQREFLNASVASLRFSESQRRSTGICRPPRKPKERS